MIFKQLVNENVSYSFKGMDETREVLSFKILNNLIYPKHYITFSHLNTWIDSWFYPDLIASLLQNIFIEGYLKDDFIKNALALCAPILTKSPRNCRFLGLVEKNKDIGKIPRSEISFYKKFYKKKGSKNYNEVLFKYDEKSKVSSIEKLFDPKDFIDRYNFFFITGSQTFELLDLRVRKAAIIIPHLLKSNLINIDNSHIIVSGMNNAIGKYQKVQFTKEALLMKNLLINKLDSYYTDLKIKPLPNNKIYEEASSRNTKENINGLLKSVSDIQKRFKIKKKKFNIFIISSTFHLLQIQQLILDQINKFNNCNIFYVGSENPRYLFKKKDDVYIKYLFMHTIGNVFQPFY